MTGKSGETYDDKIFKCTPKLAREVILGVATTGRPVYLQGPPGVGKSSILQGVADDLDFYFEDVRLTLATPPDVGGLPIPNLKEGRTEWMMPDFWPTPERAEQKGKKGCVLGFEELSSALPAVQVAAQQILLGRSIRHWNLPPVEQCIVVGAGNRVIDKTVVNKIPSAVADRLLMITIQVDGNEWRDWGVSNNVHYTVLSHHQQTGNAHLAPAFSQEESGYAFPTPRSWEFVSQIMHRYDEAKKGIGAPFSQNARNAAIYGLIGQGAGVGFITHVEYEAELPDVDALLNGKDDLPPKSYFRGLSPAVQSMLISALGSKAAPSNLKRFAQVLQLLPREFGTLAYRDCLHRQIPGLLSNPEMVKFHEEIAPYTRFS